ncbi:MAG: DUF1127 domain-containing protein [Mesorhizobium sp.]|uniref:DUF1127 domain-containing protein n=1 Tax=unclassified Mesorhizobium TaxID=325217 RepID=UPI000FD60AE3|nr:MULTISPECIES: DUF1127 domain-containing protein [unclassified Mesorhizobium]RVD51246.1 DUF1127 domain-containing protein [Mesorhizobium sp. M8A.F.Ca.ET.023.02.2.1]RWC75310.1 MAG: DUF1127 domain-containing protein [Mesorhizobium sp.]RWC89793.1 MAG: DUF1127 domain-containing protein [Mesorhizobium sp.]RWF44723.1 MAG: DUF1127 domain-containing protein [Mesorhizobium sp.]TGS36741.1 DUF1127 domain-containing protein [Mesorhizobium sp. M8A.F.Ca.ET.182.01.1.1]
MNHILASVPQALRPGMPASSTHAPRRRYSLASLRNTIAAWREQAHFRWQLKQMAQANPHLIDDIGLTTRQVEEEIAKLPFWQR